MENLKVKWYKRAQRHFDAINAWYVSNMGLKAASHFAEDTRKTTEILSHFPLIGTIDRRYSTRKESYYSFLIHPKYRIIYRFTNTTLYIVAIRATMMNS